VSIVISAPLDECSGALEIVVSDSGGGFNVDGYYQARELAASTNAPIPYGRGLALVRALCDRVEHSEAGAVVTVSYPWR
jgi:anti-sigma regulatory factor (Ser/Thr protein kinase)